MKKLAIFGAGGLGCQIKELADWQNANEHKWDEIFFVDDGMEEGPFYETRLMHLDTAIAQESVDEVEFVIALGEPSTKKKLFDRVKAAGFGFAQVIAPTARVSDSAKLGGSVICQVGSLIEPNVELGNCVTVEDYAAVGHDTLIGDYCHICAKCTIGGGSSIGEASFVGLHSAMKQGTTVGSYTTIGMGSIVVKDIPDEVIVVGNPAHVIKTRDKETKVF